MYFYFYQIEELLKIIDGNQKVCGSDFGPEFLSNEDQNILLKNGVDYKKWVSKSADSVFTYFNFGMLADSLKAAERSNFSYKQIEEFIRKGKYLPVPQKHLGAINSLQNQSFEDSIGIGNKIFCDKNKILPDNSIGAQILFLRTEIINGIAEHKTTKQIASDVAHITGDWGRDFAQIIEYHIKWATEEAELLEIKKRNPNKDVLVYKWVSKNGCSSDCIKIFLTDGLGSEPRSFKLSDVETFVDKEQIETFKIKCPIKPLHNWCSCSIFEKPPGYLWNSEKQSFSTPDPDFLIKTAKERPLIRVWINGKERYL
jgi:hypothetical protein